MASKGNGTRKMRDQAKMIFALIGDATWAEELAKNATTPHVQSARRAYVRALFALIEGALVPYRDFLLARNLSQDERRKLNDTGPDGSTRFLRLDEKWKLIYEVSLRELGSKTKPEYVKGKWQSFKKAIAIRNRITHPRPGEGIDLSDAEMSILVIAFGFCHGELLKEFLMAWVKTHPEEVRSFGTLLLEVVTKGIATLPLSSLTPDGPSRDG
jgi:hypothetical protein